MSKNRVWTTNYKFTGQELDEESGLYYYNARYYDPSLGRFLTADTIVPYPYNAQSYNRYAYVLNNPVQYTDPTGHLPPYHQLANPETAGKAEEDEYKHGGNRDKDIMEREKERIGGLDYVHNRDIILNAKLYGDGAVGVIEHQRGYLNHYVDGFLTMSQEVDLFEDRGGQSISPQALIASGKYDYLFGKAKGAKNIDHNLPRTNQNAAQMRRLGVKDNEEGRQLIQNHFEEVLSTKSNVVKKYSNKHGRFEVRESLFAGPSGKFARFESTWEVLPNGDRRLTTVIPIGGN